MTAKEFVDSLMPVQVDSTIPVPEDVNIREVHRILTSLGYDAPMNLHYREIFVTDFLPPATTDSAGFFVEDDALAARIRRELRKDPYGRKNDAIYPLLLTNAQRGDNQDVLGFVPGERGNRCAYHDDYRYVTSKVLYYSNLERCIQVVIPDFDIYGFDYKISRRQWDQIRKTADEHSRYAAGLVKEIDDWLADARVDSDPLMTMVCI